jgi:hypothetical protein
MKHKNPIRTAHEAKRRAAALKSVWSQESYLSLQTLIYIAELLEKQNRLLAKRKK